MNFVRNLFFKVLSKVTLFIGIPFGMIGGAFLFIFLMMADWSDNLEKKIT